MYKKKIKRKYERGKKMNELKVICISGVDCYENDGTVYLKLENVARGLGFTRDKNGKEYVMWDRVEKYLNELDFHTSVENGVPTSWHGDYQATGKNGLPDFIPENIFYRLAMKAKNETAEKFQALVADEIIPSIRKYGAYMTADTLEKALSSPDFLIQLATKLKEEKERNAALLEDVSRMKPKEIFADAVSVSNTAILIGELAKILKQNGVDIGQNRLFGWMRDNGYLIKRKGTDYNMPMQKSMEMGLFEIKERTITNPDGSVRITKTVLVTGKGQQYFINKFLAEVA